MLPSLLLVTLLQTPVQEPPAPVAAGMRYGEPIAIPETSARPPLMRALPGGGTILEFPDGLMSQATLRRGFNGVWYSDCGVRQPEAGQ